MYDLEPDCTIREVSAFVDLCREYEIKKVFASQGVRINPGLAAQKDVQRLKAGAAVQMRAQADSEPIRQRNLNKQARK